jgi:hypothetical protein
MSDINHLIHTNAVIAFQQGEKTERNRILEIVSSYHPSACRCDTCLMLEIIETKIKGDKK